MTPSLEGSPTKAKEAPSPHEVRLAPLDTNPVFQSLGEKDSRRFIGYFVTLLQEILLEMMFQNILGKKAFNFVIFDCQDKAEI